MLLDIGLLLAVLLVVLGILRGLSKMVDKSSPISGVILVALGIGLLIWVNASSEKDVSIRDVPNAVYRLIGDIF